MSQDDKSQQIRRHEHWGSSLGVVLAVAGSAIGLGNFLRFPGLVARYGGGAFMIPYFFSLLIVAIPIAWTEWALGRRGGRLGYHSQPGIYRAVGGGKTFWGVCGGLTALAPFIINTYYIFIEGWCLFYALQYFGGVLKSLGLGGFSLLPDLDAGLKLASSGDYAAFFGALTGAATDGSLFRATAGPLIVATIFCSAINFWLVFRGVSKGIERFCKIATPLLIVCSIIVIVRVATLGNPTGEEGRSFLDGLGFMWNPTKEVVGEDGVVVRTTVWAALSNPETWLAATSQIFYSVSICLGAIATYASYVRTKKDIALSCLTATAANEFCEVVLAGLMVVPPAFMFLGASALAGSLDSSFATGFVVLPNVFGLMPAGQFFGFVFFGLLFLAGITSSISLAQPSVALIQEAFRWTRGKSVLLALGVNSVGTGIVCWFTRDLAALDAFDFWIAQFAPFVFAMIQTILVVYVWGLPGFYREIDEGAKVRIPRFVGNLVKFVSLPYLALIFALWCRNNLADRIVGTAKEPAALLAVGFIVAVAVGLIVLVLRATRRWRAEEAENERRDSESGASTAKNA